MTRRQVDATASETEPVTIDLAALGKVKPTEYLVRFGFGAGIAALSGLVGLRFGPQAAGVFLAFPAILPASLTLIEKKQGAPQADADVRGGILGGVGMLAFAAVAVLLLPRVQPALALAVALGAWAVVAAGLFFVVGRRPFFARLGE